MAVAEWTGTLVDWGAELARLKRFIASALGRSETREAASAFIDGLLSSAERKTGWMLAEEAGPRLLTTPEIRVLIAKLLLSPTTHPAFVRAWSRWRRDHQAVAAVSHRKGRSHAQL